MASTRRLAAILAADVACYSRLMGADEEGTHERLKAHLRELVDPRIEEHRGRIVKHTGDGLLAEFPSVVDAVRCAIEVQREMITREPDVPEERRIRFRIGVNLGDVIVEEHDIFGDGVNVAARVEALAEPGSICISRTVRDHVRDKLPYQFEDLGEQSVKNIARPVRVYAMRLEAIADLPAPSVPTLTPRRQGTVRVTTAAVAVAALAIAASAWWLWPTTKPSPAPLAAATSISRPLVPPRLSIVALPFANLTNDSEQQYLADGITENLTTDLSRLQDMLVISRNTAFTYKEKRIETKQIGRELSVRYVLEGSVQRSGNRLRVTAQLIDSETDAHLWAERFDRDMGDLFALQNDITSRIAVALNLELVAAEAARQSENPDALDYILRGRDALAKPPTRDSYAEGISLLERALAADPGSIDAQGWLARALVGRVLDGVSASPDQDIQRTESLLKQALAASPRNPYLHYVKGQVLRAVAQGPFGLNAEARILRFADAIPEYELVIAANPNDVKTLAHLAWCKFMTGAENEAIPLLEKSIRLSPRDPYLYLYYWRLGTVHFFQGPSTRHSFGWKRRAARTPLSSPRIRCLPPPTASKATRIELPPNSPRSTRSYSEPAIIAFRRSPLSGTTATGTRRRCTTGSKSFLLLVCVRPECPSNDRNPPSSCDLGGGCRGLLTTDRG
jgi:TolB-like protein/class 3 adenylate cyclase